MSKVLGIQTRIIIFVVSFLLSGVHRTVTRAWPFSRASGETQGQCRARGLTEALVLRIGSLAKAGEHYTLELNSAFPYIHFRPLSATSVAVILSSSAFLAAAAEVPGLGASLFLGEVGMLAAAPGTCPAPAPGGPGPGPIGSPGPCPSLPSFSCPDCYC
jgi:hypothetical protein